MQTFKTKSLLSIFQFLTASYSTRNRSSHPEVFLGKNDLKICRKFTGEQPCQSAISIKLLTLHWGSVSSIKPFKLRIPLAVSLKVDFTTSFDPTRGIVLVKFFLDDCVRRWCLSLIVALTRLLILTIRLSRVMLISWKPFNTFSLIARVFLGYYPWHDNLSSFSFIWFPVLFYMFLLFYQINFFFAFV